MRPSKQIARTTGAAVLLAALTSWIRNKWPRSISREILLNQELDRIDRDYKSNIAEARRAGKFQDIEVLESEWSFEQEPYIADLKRIETQRWRSEASRYFVPMPEIKDEPDENWRRMTVAMDGSECWYLTEAAEARIWTSIRERKKDLREARLAYISAAGPLITPLTAILGAILGYFAGLHHGSK